MNITVNEQPQRFYLAAKKWVGVVGHEIKVGKYRFCAIPINGSINVSEITSGAKVYNIPMDLTIMLLTETKEETIKFFYTVGESIKRIIEKQEDFDAMIANMKKTAFDKLGEMPPIEDVEVKQ
ncbi:hypothetical protein KK120_08825 [Virgibacillus dakarensis]|nr:hypothetical protein [Virgibacillus dakarensis]MBT2215925.1 hypothetical protein [Virgibacillus dakarensis]